MKKRRKKAAKACAKQNEISLTEEASQLMIDKLALYKEHLTIHLIEVGRIYPPPEGEPPDKTGLNSLCESVRRWGLLEPLTVRRICADDSPLGGIFELVAGKRRLEALKMLGITRAPCCIAQIGADKRLETQINRELRARDDQHGPFALADKIKDVYSEKQDFPALAKDLALSENELRQFLLLSGLSENERSLITEIGFPRDLVLAIAEIQDAGERKRAIAESAACISHLIKVYRQPLFTETRKRGIVTNLVPAINALERVIVQLRASGVAASMNKTESAEQIEFTIQIKKQSVRTFVTSPEARKTG